MLALILLVICACACALPSSIITQDAEKINLQSSKELTLPCGRRSDVVGIVGGNVTTIDVHPYAVIILIDGTWYCGGTIISPQSVLTAAYCKSDLQSLRFRVGSSMAFSGGTVHTLESFMVHPKYNEITHDNDVAIVRSATKIDYIANTVQPAVYAGADYNLADNEKVWALGWGDTSDCGYPSDQLRHVQIFTINQKICNDRYSDNPYKNTTITDNMLCAGVLDVGGKNPCFGDYGGPLVHNGVVVGISSFAVGCGEKNYPVVSTRVSRVADWIEKNK